MTGAFRTLPPHLVPTLALSEALVFTLDGYKTRDPPDVVRFYCSTNIVGTCKLGWLLHQLEREWRAAGWGFLGGDDRCGGADVPGVL